MSKRGLSLDSPPKLWRGVCRNSRNWSCCRSHNPAQGHFVVAIVAYGDQDAGDDFHDAVITLLHDAQLHEISPGSPHGQQSGEADPRTAVLPIN